MTLGLSKISTSTKKIRSYFKGQISRTWTRVVVQFLQNARDKLTMKVGYKFKRKNDQVNIDGTMQRMDVTLLITSYYI